MTSLAGHADGLGFSELKALCGLTAGNLSRHLTVLDEAGLIALDKSYEGKRPVTRCRLTADGRVRFAAYLDVLQEVVLKASSAGAAAARKRTEPKSA